MDTVNITCKLQKFNNDDHEIHLTAFCFQFNGNMYLVSTHHGLPIESCHIDDDTENKVTIFIDSVWNELIVFKTETTINNIKIFTKYSSKVPKNDDTLFIKKDDIKIRLTNSNAEFSFLFGIATNPKIIYIRADVMENSVEKSYSGSPVFNENNKLVGILSKRNIADSTACFIPIYILIKTLSKTDNNSIYALDYNQQIKKLGSKTVKNDVIMHKTLGTAMDLNTYFLIEGDYQTTETVNGTDIIYTNINEYLYIDNTKEIFFEKNCYRLTTRLFTLLKTLYCDLGMDIFEIIKKNYQNKINVYVNKKIKQKKYIEISNEHVNLKFVII